MMMTSPAVSGGEQQVLLVNDEAMSRLKELRGDPEFEGKGIRIYTTGIS